MALKIEGILNLLTFTLRRLDTADSRGDWTTIRSVCHLTSREAAMGRLRAKFFLALASWWAQDGGVTAPRAGRGHHGWPMAAHQLASVWDFFCVTIGTPHFTTPGTRDFPENS